MTGREALLPGQRDALSRRLRGVLRKEHRALRELPAPSPPAIESIIDTYEVEMLGLLVEFCERVATRGASVAGGVLRDVERAHLMRRCDEVNDEFSQVRRTHQRGLKAVGTQAFGQQQILADGIATNEVLYSFSLGEVSAWRASGSESFVLISTGCCPDCDDLIVVENAMPPLHAGCSCYLLPAQEAHGGVPVP